MVYYGLFLLVAFKVLFGLHGIVPVVKDERTEGNSRYLRRTACGAGEYCKSTAGVELVWVDYTLYILAAILLLAPLPWLRRVCRLDGSLDKLGLGKTELSLWAERWTRWQVWLLCVLASCFFIRYFVLAGLVGPTVDPKGEISYFYGVFSFKPFTDETDNGEQDEMTQLANFTLFPLPVALPIEKFMVAVYYGIGAPLVLAFVASLCVAAALANDEIREVINSVEDTDPDTEEWAQVDKAACALHEETMQCVSNGWGFGVTAVFLWAFAEALGKAIDLLQNEWVHDHPKGHIFVHMLEAAGFALLPLVLFFPIAGSSTQCNELTESLCHKAMKNPNSRGKIKALADTLGKTNWGQGVGFVVPLLGVLDTAMIWSILKFIVGLTSVAYSFVVVRKPPDAAQECALSAQQRMAVQSLLATFDASNTSCAYNLTDVVGVMQCQN